MKIKCIIIDDEPLARKGIKEYINDVDFFELAGEFDNPVKAIDTINSQKADVVFLDIEMPKLTGFDFLKTLKHLPPVIFITAYPQYALDGFNLNALDYLVKPVSFNRFYQAALKVKEYYELRQKNNEAIGHNKPDYFFVKADNKLVKLFFNDVLFVEAVQNYVNIHTIDKKYMSYLTFKSVEEYLPEDEFLKTHKSYIVSINKIESIEGNEIKIKNHSIPISRIQKDAVLQKLLTNKFLKR